MNRKTACSAAFLAGAVLIGIGPATAQEASSPPAPPADAPGAVPPYTVAAGDSLSHISDARLGTSDRWLEIFVINRDLIQDPNQIEVGQILQIPSAPIPIPPDVLAPPSPGDTNPVGGADSRATPTSPRTASAGGGGGAGDLAGIRRCESGGNYRAVSPNGQYRGAYQFDRRTWASVGGSGDPAAASPAEQDARARQLQSQRGGSPWSNCG